MKQAKIPSSRSAPASEAMAPRRAMLFWFAASGIVWAAVAVSVVWLI